jgi:transcriptional/translational regulatory protein YebC/TACO1
MNTWGFQHPRGFKEKYYKKIYHHMSGHSKWSQIKRKKGVTDVKRSQLFSKIAKVLTSESKRAKGDATTPSLRVAIEKAKSANVPKDVIDRAIKKGSEDKGDQMEVVIYEAYGPGGVALIIEGLTDNKNKAVAEIKHILSKNGSALAASGSALWAFTKVGQGYDAVTVVDLNDQDLEKLDLLVEALEENEEVQEVFTNAN